MFLQNNHQLHFGENQLCFKNDSSLLNAFYFRFIYSFLFNKKFQSTLIPQTLIDERKSRKWESELWCLISLTAVCLPSSRTTPTRSTLTGICSRYGRTTVFQSYYELSVPHFIVPLLPSPFLNSDWQSWLRLINLPTRGRMHELFPTNADKLCLSDKCLPDKRGLATNAFVVCTNKMLPDKRLSDKARLSAHFLGRFVRGNYLIDAQFSLFA